MLSVVVGRRSLAVPSLECAPLLANNPYEKYVREAKTENIIEFSHSPHTVTWSTKPSIFILKYLSFTFYT